MKICQIQFDIAWGDPQANCAHLDGLLARAPQAELYVLPEMFTTGFATLPGAIVEHEPSYGLAWMQRKAKELHAAIAGSIAGPFFGIPETLRRQALGFLPEDLKEILFAFEARFGANKAPGI